MNWQEKVCVPHAEEVERPLPAMHVTWYLILVINRTPKNSILGFGFSMDHFLFQDLRYNEREEGIPDVIG
jgi:hypothetical protein